MTCISAWPLFTDTELTKIVQVICTDRALEKFNRKKDSLIAEVAFTIVVLGPRIS